jgi:branched-chain amino acid transport system ATP-binding protein
LVTPILELVDVEVHYSGVKALHGVSLALMPGELFLLVGPNGAGKSTLLKTVVGVKRPTSGSVRFLGEDITHMPAHERARHGIAWIPEGRGIIPQLSVKDNLDLARLADRTWESAARDASYGRFPILEAAQNRPAGSLSGGEQQMLAVARALESRPRVLLVDEPSLGLAPQVADQVMQLLGEIAKEGYSTIVVEQRTAAIMDLCDRFVLLRNGVLEAETDEVHFAEMNFETYLS